MATFLFASIPVPAHTTNPICFAERLLERGHRVLWYAGRAFHERLAAIGATPLPYVHADDFGGDDLAEHFPSIAGLDGVAAIRTAFADIFVGQAADRVRDLRAILAEHEVDAILCDELMFGVGMVSELDDVPWATFGDGPFPIMEPDTPPFGPALLPLRGPVGRLRNKVVGHLGRTIIFAEAQRVYERTRRDLGLPVTGESVFEGSVSPYLHLHGAVPSFDYPRRQVPAHVHWVGALRPRPAASWQPPVWWDELLRAPQPVLLVSQGSIRPDLAELVLPTVRALADNAALVVVTTGQAEPSDLVATYGAPLPANVRVAKHVPYDLLLPHVSVFVTNGGYTGVTLALAHGVPLVQAGTTEEKSEIAARIHWTGVGVRLGTTRPTPAAVGAGVQRVLTRPSYRAAASVVQAEMATHDAGTEGADLLEALVTTPPTPEPVPTRTAPSAS